MFRICPVVYPLTIMLHLQSFVSLQSPRILNTSSPCLRDHEVKPLNYLRVLVPHGPSWLVPPLHRCYPQVSRKKVGFLFIWYVCAPKTTGENHSLLTLCVSLICREILLQPLCIRSQIFYIAIIFAYSNVLRRHLNAYIFDANVVTWECAIL